MTKLLYAVFFLAAILLHIVAFGGQIVPGLDDATALIDVAAARAGIGGDIVPVEGAGQITLAASFTPSIVDLTASGPVIIIECGGTSYGNGLYISGGNLIFATKGSNGFNGNNSTQTSLNDIDVSDNAAAVTIGPLQEGIETHVYASYDTNKGQLTASINGMVTFFSISSTVSWANLSGDESVSFFGSGAINAGQLGGLTNTAQGQSPLWDANQAVNFAGAGGTVRGQIFAAVAGGITDHDIVISETGGFSVVQEGGNADELVITMSDDPENYPVRIKSSDASDPNQVQVTPSQIVFDSSNWQASQSLYVSAMDDSFQESQLHATSLKFNVLTHTSSGYYMYSITNVDVTIQENDCAVWGINNSDFNRDCQINLADFAEFISQWLECSLPEIGCTDYR